MIFEGSQGGPQPTPWCREAVAPLTAACLVLNVEENAAGSKSVEARTTPRRCDRMFHLLCNQRNLFEIILNQPEIRLYIPFLYWFASKRTSIWMSVSTINTIWFRVDLMRFRKAFSVCRQYTHLINSTFCVTVCSNRWWELNKCRVERMGASDSA